MQVSESGLAIHPSPAKHLMRPSLAFFEIFYWFQTWFLTNNGQVMDQIYQIVDRQHEILL